MGSGVDEHSWSLPVSARVVRLRPTDHYAWNCLRVEVHGFTPGMSLFLRTLNVSYNKLLSTLNLDFFIRFFY